MILHHMDACITDKHTTHFRKLRHMMASGLAAPKHAIIPVQTAGATIAHRDLINAMTGYLYVDEKNSTGTTWMGDVLGRLSRSDATSRAAASLGAREPTSPCTG